LVNFVNQALYLGSYPSILAAAPLQQGLGRKPALTELAEDMPKIDAIPAISRGHAASLPWTALDIGVNSFFKVFRFIASHA
jgi:hypothetical protein